MPLRVGIFGRKVPRCVVITGASRGLGRALALAYAQRGIVLGLVARDDAALAAAAEVCRERGAETVVLAADVVVPDALTAWLAALDRKHPIDLLIANAGQFDGRRLGAAGEALEGAVALVRVNLEGAMRTIDAVLPFMRARGRGHIAAISSLAALFPLADAPAYSASKAGLSAYCEALRALLAPAGIQITIVCPGHIATRQTEIHRGTLPLLMSSDEAARRIVSGLERGRAHICLPGTLAVLARLNRLLPLGLSRIAEQSLRFSVRDSGQGD
jgi:short-subunit dehydrogenase